MNYQSTISIIDNKPETYNLLTDKVSLIKVGAPNPQLCFRLSDKA